jgi:flagellar FliJ protein
MFRFRLQRVLDLRERKERDAASALVSAREQAERAREEQERLTAAREALAAQATAGGAPQNAPSIGVLRTLHYLLGRLDERVASAATEMTTAEHEVAQRQDELTAAFRDRRTLDRLRERHEESWRAAEAAADRQRMDEIALTRFQQPSARQTGAVPQSDAENSTNES